jgi:calreticulin
MSVKHEQKLDCGGAYIKLLGDLDQAEFGGDSPYDIMFGPDICGTGTRKTHTIFGYNDENLLVNSDIRCETDQLSHLYTLHIKAEDNSFDVLIDNKSVKKGALADNWEFLLPAEIKDPEVSKPNDWVDEKKIPDPEASKPDGWDDIPAQIPDPEAEKPGDWDDEDDGEWEPPMIDNSEFSGEWEHPLIVNPEYNGEWEHPLIANPDFVNDDALHHRCHNCQHIGFELWQVKAGTIFDDIIVTDDLAEAQAFAEETFFAKKDAEKTMFEEVEQERKDAEKAEREEKEAVRKAEKEAEDAAKAAAEDEDDDGEEYEDEHEEL